MKQMKIFLILILLCAFGVTGCEKKNTSETKTTESTTATTTSSKEPTTSTTTSKTTAKKTTTTKKSTKKTTTTKKTTKAVTTKPTGQIIIDGKPECDASNAEYVAYVEKYKRDYAKMKPENKEKEPYVVFFYTKAERDDYVEHAYSLRYINEGSAIPYENSTCKGKMYTQILRISHYKRKILSKAVYIPATPKDKLIPAETYIEQNGLLHLVSE